MAVALGAAFLGGFIGSARTAQEQHALRERQVVVYQNEVARISEKLEEFGHEQAGHVSREEVDELRVGLGTVIGINFAVTRGVPPNKAL